MVQGGPDTAWVGVQPWHCPHPSVLNEWFMKSWKLPPRFQRKVWNARHYGRGRVPAGHSWEGDTWSCAGDICATMETPACWRCQEHMMSSEESHRQWVEQSKKEDSTGKTLEIGFPWMPDAVLHELLFTLMGLTFAWSESFLLFSIPSFWNWSIYLCHCMFAECNLFLILQGLTARSSPWDSAESLMSDFWMWLEY
jgi:hypothetical protein